MHICISKDSILTQYGNGGENMPHLSGKAGFLVCSNTNTDREGSNRCHWVQSVNKKLIIGDIIVTGRYRILSKELQHGMKVSFKIESSSY